MDNHYTPTYAYWLNQVERGYCFAEVMGYGIFTQRAIRGGSFSSVEELTARNEQFVADYNKTKAPFNQGPVQLDSRSGLNPGEAPASLYANLRDGTLGKAWTTTKRRIET
jgi:hypothetical protein